MIRYHQAALIAAAWVALAATPVSAQTTIVTFDDLPSNAQFSNPMPSGYGGIEWTGGNWFYLTCGITFVCPTGGTDPYPYTPHSFPRMATVDFLSGTTQQFGFLDGPKVFNGAWVSTFDGDFFGYTLKLGGVIVHMSLGTSNSVPSFAASGYGGLIDEVDIIASDIGDWIIDDVSFTTPVPEPSTLLLMGPAMFLTAVALRRRRTVWKCR